MNRNRVFGADIDKSLVGANGVSGNSHCLDNTVRVALQYTSVHKRTGVTLIGVTGNKFLVALCFCGEIPLHTCRESAAAASSQSRCLYRFDNLFGGHLGKNLSESLISVKCYVLIDIFGVDNTAVSKSNSVLFLIKINLV